MRRAILKFGLASLLLAISSAPALAEEPPKDAPAADEPSISGLVLPVPFIAIYGAGAISNLHIGPTLHELSARGGYVWAINTAFNPDTTKPQTLLTAPEDYWQPANYWNLLAAWGWHMAPRWTLYLDGYAAGGGLAQTPGYDQALTQGVSATWGPLLDYNTLDALDFPTKGFQAQLGWAPGYHWGEESLGFQRASVDLRKFIPMGPDRTLVFRTLGMAGWPKLAWVDKFSAGGSQYLRGYQWNRFTGDRLFSNTVEFRWLFLPDILSALGWPNGGVAVGLGWEAYADAGRAWESSRGVPFLSDMRLGAGTGFMLTLNRVSLGRIELNVSEEGLYSVAGFGASF